MLKENSKKRLLHIIPYNDFVPARNGGALRCYHLCKELSKYFQVTVLTTQNFENINDKVFDGIEIVNPLRITSTIGLKNRIMNAIKFRYYQKSFFGPSEITFLQFYPVLKKLSKIEKYDYILMEHLNVIELGEVIKNLFPKAIRIADQHNVDHLLFKQTNQIDTLKNKKSFQRFKTQESNLYKNADYFFTCSTNDKLFLEKLNKNRIKGFVVANGTSKKPIDLTTKDFAVPRLIFCGVLDTQSNKNGLIWFYYKVWPTLKKEVKGIKLMIVGRNGFDSAYLPLKNDKQINFIGEVSDVSKYYLKNNIAIVPLQEGSGTRLKILEAMNHGNPVISTSIGAEGIECSDGNEILIANNAFEFVDKTLKIINSKELALRITKNARHLIESRYYWESIVKNIEVSIKNLSSAEVNN